MGETTASLVITVEGKEAEGWRKQGCWGWNRRWWAERKEGVARLEFRPPPRPPRARGLPPTTEGRCLIRASRRSPSDDGDRQAQTWLRKVLDAYPVLWERAGDLAVHAQLSLIHLISKGEWFLGEALKRRLEELRRDLEAPFPTPLEKLAVERVVAAWANLYHVETMCLGVEGDLAERKYWLKKQDQAHRQYLAATKSLMMVQTMLSRPTPGPPIPSTTRFRLEGPSTPPGGNGPDGSGNGSGGNGREGGCPVPAFATDNGEAQQTGFGNGQSANRIAAMVGAGS